jgi:hypothetical protein
VIFEMKSDADGKTPNVFSHCCYRMPPRANHGRFVRNVTRPLTRRSERNPVSQLAIRDGAGEENVETD